MLLEQLRCATRELHRQTERALDLRRACASTESYEDLLLQLLGFYEPLEAQLFSRPGFMLQSGLDFEARRKTPLLRADLAVLGRARPEPRCCGFVPRIESDAFLLGAWYVVEGATLGGRIIAAHLRHHLALSATTGAGFFGCYGDLRQRRWSEYCAFLSSRPEAESRPAVAGAVAVFDAMRRWLQNRQPMPSVVSTVFEESSNRFSTLSR
jgi:heme oxygenase